MRSLSRIPPHRQFYRGFTLAELLIALLILAIIATFAIPKVLQGQTNATNNSIVKETAATISTAYMQYKNNGVIASTTGTSDLMPYFNYIRRDTITLIDDAPPATYQCDSGAGICLKLHNGGILYVRPWITFSGTASTNAIYFTIDPDGKASTIQGVNLFLYTDGRVTSENNVLPNTISSDGTRNPNAGKDPAWFQW